MASVEEITLLEEGKKIEEGFLKSLVGQRVLVNHYTSKEPVILYLFSGEEEDAFSIRNFKGTLFEAFGRGEFYDSQEGRNIPGICTSTWREKNGILTEYKRDFIIEVKTDSNLFPNEIRYHNHNKMLTGVGL